MAQFILLAVKSEFFIILRIVIFKSFLIFVGIHIMMCCIDKTGCYIRAMVGGSFKVGKKVSPDKACFNGTFTISKTNLFKPINNLLQRLNVTS